MEAGLEIIPVLNKIDLPGAEPERRRDELLDLLGVQPEEVHFVSAKDGTGVPALLETLIHKVPPPTGDSDAPVRALIFDSFYDKYRGAIPSIRVVDGVLRKGMSITFGSNSARYEIDEVGYLQLGHFPLDQLGPGEVGYLTAAIKK